VAAPEEQPMVRCDSPELDTMPTRALGAPSGFSRCLSTTSTFSHGSATTDASYMRESLGSDISAFSRQSSGSYQSSRPSDINTSGHVLRTRQSTGSLNTPNTSRSDGRPSRRRGFMRPQGTDFAASARSRESVLSLGSIAHLQYYFARTGLLDGKGGQLARKRQQKAHTLDLSALTTSSFLTPKAMGSDHDSSYASMGSSPDLTAHSAFGRGGMGTDSIVESPLEEHHPGLHDEEYYLDESDENDEPMLPPTTSTYINREKPLPKPPSIIELKLELKAALSTATDALSEAKATTSSNPLESAAVVTPSSTPKKGSATPPGWYEIQGMHILDVMTLAIRAAKIYYTTHDRPDRLDAIKSEKEIRGELLSVMDVLKRMATRGFTGGMRDDEFRIMDAWIAGLRALLAAEDDIKAAEAAERTGWTWLKPSTWEGREYAREEAFIRSMLEGSTDPVEGMEPLPTWTPIGRSSPVPTPFLLALQNGLRLVQLHNCAVHKSQQRFGTIGTFHTDTQKPYRAADNLRYWIKAAELRWEVLLKADALGLQYNTSPLLWVDFEDVILKWCRKVREEIAGELQ
ncbi:hypothetical protein B0T17DRAFT_461200, partial [Bombardia bombarda]